MTDRGGVLVVGDANPDLVLRGDTAPRWHQAEQLLDAAELVLGGSAAIAACGIARLGIPTALAAVLGVDRFGDAVAEDLAERGVDLTAVRRDPGVPTGLTVLLMADDDRTMLTLPGTIPALTADDVRAAVAARRPAHVHVASFFLQPALAAELPGLLGELRAAGIGTSLDTNADPAGAWRGLAEVLPLVDVLLPNAAEAQAIARGLGLEASTPEAAARAIAGLGPRVVMKAGEDGGIVVDRDGVRRASALRVPVVDATGAGDSFDAGYLAALAAGIAEEAVRLRWAVAAGSLSTRAAGGTAAQATRAELDAALATAP